MENFSELADLFTVGAFLAAALYGVYRALRRHPEDFSLAEGEIIEVTEELIFDPEVISRLEEFMETKETLKRQGQSLVKALELIESFGIESEISTQLKRLILELIDDIPFSNKELGLNSAQLVETPKD